MSLARLEFLRELLHEGSHAEVATQPQDLEGNYTQIQSRAGVAEQFRKGFELEQNCGIN
jgi:hypothetical protein